MKKYKVNNDQQKPSKKEVQQYKNFAQLKHQYDRFTKRPKKPFYKDPKLFLGLVVIVIIVYLIFEQQDVTIIQSILD